MQLAAVAVLEVYIKFALTAWIDPVGNVYEAERMCSPALGHC